MNTYSRSEKKGPARAQNIFKKFEILSANQKRVFQTLCLWSNILFINSYSLKFLLVCYPCFFLSGSNTFSLSSKSTAVRQDKICRQTTSWKMALCLFRIMLSLFCARLKMFQCLWCGHCRGPPLSFLSWWQALWRTSCKTPASTFQPASGWSS